MFKSNPLLLLVLILLLASLACSTPGVALTPDANFMSTAVAQTLAAIQSPSMQTVTPLAAGTNTPTPTITPSPTITLSPTPLFTETPLVPQISVSVATNCRVGPGKAYDRVGALLVGEVTEVIARDPIGSYWYVRNPNAPHEFCWLWGEYATLSGNFLVLPIFTPPPTPTPVPAFDLSYVSREMCNNNWWVEFKMKNTGGLTFSSLSMVVSDLDAKIVLSMKDNKFTNSNGCNAFDSRNALGPGEEFVVSSPAFLYDPVGHNLRATVTLCSEDGVNGTCVTRDIEFKP